MNNGPMEIVQIVFPGNQFSGEVIPALRELVVTKTVRIVDIAIVIKDETGNAFALELADMDPGASQALLELVDGSEGLFSDEDLMAFANALEVNSTAALIIFENTWAARFTQAVANSKGQVVFNERIPRAVLEELAAAAR